MATQRWALFAILALGLYLCRHLRRGSIPLGFRFRVERFFLLSWFVFIVYIIFGLGISTRICIKVLRGA